MRRYLHAALMASLFIVHWAAPAEGQSEPFRSETEHYIVKTDTSAQFAAIVGRHMEAIYGEYSQRFKGYKQMSQRFNVAVIEVESKQPRSPILDTHKCDKISSRREGRAID